MSLPQVISQDPEVVLAECIEWYEGRTGKSLHPAQIDSLYLDFVAYRETILRTAINEGARQGLVDFANLIMLQYLGNFVNTFLLPAQSARTTLRFSLTVPVAGPTVIEKSHRVQAATGAVFLTAYEVFIPAGQTYVDVLALADETGEQHNGYLPNSITQAFDTLPDGVSVSNLTTTDGGSAQEEVERFRKRVKLAMSRPSAGSLQAFLYLALSADIRVIDANVFVMAPGWIRVAILTAGDGSEVLANVFKAISKDDSRPLTDNVDAVLASAVNLSIEIALIPRLTGVAGVILDSAHQVMESIKAKLKNKLGYDSVSSQISASLQAIDGVKKVILSGADSPIAPDQHAVLSWTINIMEAEAD